MRKIKIVFIVFILSFCITQAEEAKSVAFKMGCAVGDYEFRDVYGTGLQLGLIYENKLSKNFYSQVELNIMNFLKSGDKLFSTSSLKAIDLTYDLKFGVNKRQKSPSPYIGIAAYGEYDFGDLFLSANYKYVFDGHVFNQVPSSYNYKQNSLFFAGVKPSVGFMFPLGENYSLAFDYTYAWQILENKDYVKHNYSYVSFSLFKLK